MKIDKKFNLILSSDLSFEGMVVDVCYGNETVAMVNYDKGIDHIEIEIFPFSNESQEKFPINDYILILEKAKKLAYRCAQEDLQRTIY